MWKTKINLDSKSWSIIEMRGLENSLKSVYIGLQLKNVVIF